MFGLERALVKLNKSVQETIAENASNKLKMKDQDSRIKNLQLHDSKLREMGEAVGVVFDQSGCQVVEEDFDDQVYRIKQNINIV